MQSTTTTDDDQPMLFCAVCGSLMRADEALPAPEDVPDTLRYHTNISTCWLRLAQRPASVSQWRPIARTA